MENNVKNSILIVDDEKLQLKTLALILGQDYTVYVTSSGEEAIEIAEKYLPDLILLDIVMPGMDGYEVLSRLKSNPSASKIPVVFITGLRSDEDQVKGLGSDVVDYITKPFNEQIVLLRVRNQMKIIDQIRTIEHLSRIDQLTNIPNRRYFTERIKAEWSSSMRNRRHLSILILDIDFFKKYNDTYGHQQGDAAVAATAQAILSSLSRANDFAARYGGEEFAVLLPDVDSAGALRVAERIRSAIESTLIPLSGGEATSVTVSIGVNTLVPKLDDSLDFFISCADSALYTSKNNGRNQVSVYKKV